MGNIEGLKLGWGWNRGTKGVMKPNQTSFKKGEHRSKATEFKKGEVSEKIKGKNNFSWKGGKYATKFCIVCGKRCANKIAKKCRECWCKDGNNGENHPSWKGGATKWKKRMAMIRDNFTCQICGLEDKEVLEVDHIKPKALSPELKFSLENLITLCANCHRRKTNRELKEKLYVK